MIDRLDELFMEVTGHLSDLPYVTDVRVCQPQPVQWSDVSQWEQKNGVSLPRDAKQFYLSNDGFQLEWNAVINNRKFPVADMKLLPLSLVAPVTLERLKINQPALVEFLTTPIEGFLKEGAKNTPGFTDKFKIFEIEDCRDYGKACLVFQKDSDKFSFSGVWFLDRALRWHFIAGSLMRYYRLALMHLCLKQWQYLYTDVGLSAKNLAWFSMFCPTRLRITQGNVDATTPKVEHVKLDRAKLLQVKPGEKKRPPPPTPTKRK